jgi:hypothetical protein
VSRQTIDPALVAVAETAVYRQRVTSGDADLWSILQTVDARRAKQPRRRSLKASITERELRALWKLALRPEPPHQDDAQHRKILAVEPRRRLFPHEIRLNPDGTLDEVVAFGHVHLEQMDTGCWVLLIDGLDGHELRVPLSGAARPDAGARHGGAAGDRGPGPRGPGDDAAAVGDRPVRGVRRRAHRTEAGRRRPAIMNYVLIVTTVVLECGASYATHEEPAS